jgi:hypothetical protein
MRDPMMTNQPMTKKMDVIDPPRDLSRRKGVSSALEQEEISLRAKQLS